MSTFFEWSTTSRFSLFSAPQLLTLGIIAIITLVLFIFRKQLRKKGPNLTLRISIVCLLILSEISYHLWFLYHNQWDLTSNLPLQLSSISLFLAIFMILTKRFILFEITYFAGTGSAVLAMITPDLGVYAFPHFRFFHFFIAHGGIVIATWHMAVIERFIPSYHSVWKAFLTLNIYVVALFMVNLLLNANYMFLMKKPLTDTLLTYLGPWPYYLLSLEGVAIIAFHLLYLPFYFSKRVVTKHSATPPFSN
ncbi:MAG: TIGR02206 family membrane protein [Anaerobacillus sp.]